MILQQVAVGPKTGAAVFDAATTAKSLNGIIHCTISETGIRAYRLNGSSLTTITTQDDGGLYLDLVFRNNYIFVACSNSGLRAYSYNGTYNLIDTIDEGGTYRGVWDDGNYVYCACAASGLKAYTFNGAAFAAAGNIDDGGTYQDVWGDGTYIYVATSAPGVLRAYTFAGGVFTLRGTYTEGPTFFHFAKNSTGTIFVTSVTEQHVSAFSFNGTTFSLIDRVNYATTNVNGVTCYGKYVFVATENYLYAYDFSSNTFSEITITSFTLAGTTYPWNLGIDEDYIYFGVNSSVDSLRAFSWNRELIALFTKSIASGKAPLEIKFTDESYEE